MSILKVENVSKYFDNEKVIDSINLHLNKGEIISLLGVSGGGKTTLFNIIAGLSTPEEGRVFLNDEDITSKPGKISYMLQKDLLLPYKTVADNVALPLVIKGLKKSDARQKVIKYFDSFGLSGMEDKYPAQLSGGMKQRAALLRTYMFSDSVALLDEPFSALDMITKKSIHKWYLQVMEDIQLSTLFVTHDIDEALLLSDRIYMLTGKPGQITKEIVIDQPRPRDDSFQLSEKYAEYKKEILEHLAL